MENVLCINMVWVTNFTLREDLSGLLFAVDSSCNVSAIYFQILCLTFSY